MSQQTLHRAAQRKGRIIAARRPAVDSPGSLHPEQPVDVQMIARTHAHRQL